MMRRAVGFSARCSAGGTAEWLTDDLLLLISRCHTRCVCTWVRRWRNIVRYSIEGICMVLPITGSLKEPDKCSYSVITWGVMLYCILVALYSALVFEGGLGACPGMYVCNRSVQRYSSVYGSALMRCAVLVLLCACVVVQCTVFCGNPRSKVGIIIVIVIIIIITDQSCDAACTLNAHRHAAYMPGHPHRYHPVHHHR